MLKQIVSEEQEMYVPEVSTASDIKRSRKMIKQALDEYFAKLEKDMKQNLDMDNRSELNKIFQVYHKLDQFEEGIQVYLNYIVEKRAPELEGEQLPMLTNRDELPELRTFLYDHLIPQATQMISKEVSVMVPTGRIVVIIGSDQRYMTSLRLITCFVNEYYRKLIYQYLRRDFGKDDAFQLETTELIIRATAYFFFDKLG